jgi:hypothetical protein
VSAGGAETRIGVAGSVRVVPAIAKAPTISPTVSATPATPHAKTMRFLRSIAQRYRPAD